MPRTLEQSHRNLEPCSRLPLTCSGLRLVSIASWHRYGLTMKPLGHVLRADGFAVVVTAVPWAQSQSQT